MVTLHSNLFMILLNRLSSGISMELDWHSDAQAYRDGLLLEVNDVDSSIDMAVVRGYRLQRFRDEMAKHDIAAWGVFGSGEIRFARGGRNLPGFYGRKPARFLLVSHDPQAGILY